MGWYIVRIIFSCRGLKGNGEVAMLSTVIQLQTNTVGERWIFFRSPTFALLPSVSINQPPHPPGEHASSLTCRFCSRNCSSQGCGSRGGCVLRTAGMGEGIWVLESRGLRTKPAPAPSWLSDLGQVTTTWSPGFHAVKWDDTIPKMRGAK